MSVYEKGKQFHDKYLQQRSTVCWRKKASSKQCPISSEIRRCKVEPEKM
jgi:hypothetical protein